MLRGGRFGLKPGGLDDLEQRGPGAKERALAAPAGHLLEPESLLRGDRLVELRDDLDEALAMPQKLNPDVAELVRGKAGAALGRLAGLLATVKGLPLAYNRDLQEDKPPVFAARRDLRLSLDALAVLVGESTFDRGRLAAACADPLLLATDAAEQLVSEGVPFREAYERVAASVRQGTFAPPATRATRAASGPGGVNEALVEARDRFS